MAAGIFVSYRRDDVRHVAGRLAGDLADRFGTDTIFRDVESIEGGEEFPAQLEKALAQCAIMLVVIGLRWLDIRNAEGRRRLDDPDDWVRQEVAAALKRGIRVVPVLVEDTRLPSEDELPEDLKPLVRRQARPLSDERWRGDLEAIVEMLAKVPGLTLQQRSAPPAAAVPPATAPASSRLGLWGAGVVTAAALGGVALWSSGGSDHATEPAATTAASSGPDLPDLSGTWRTDTGGTWTPDSDLSYTVVQQGRELRFVVWRQDEQIGVGEGRFEGDGPSGGSMNLVFNVRYEKDRVVTENCDLTAGEGYRRFAGSCVSPAGRIEYTIRR